eukprot:TRINITY_DN5519_c0_g2_i1.p1 TRINITY_DN5519_c0_g2~~TRINITY_DN5519_c0_g2_i1.p1  ORF type:complete len:639 (+),score=147.82 TRINITY_DN5519_c0_g2_i1:61-1977(+)
MASQQPENATEPTPQQQQPPQQAQGSEENQGAQSNQSWQQYDYSQYYNQGYYPNSGYEYPQEGQQSYAQGYEQWAQANPQQYAAPPWSSQQYGYHQPGGYPPYPQPWGVPGRPPAPRQQQQPSNTVWVGGLHPDTNEFEIRQAFEPYGEIENVKLLPHKCCAFLRFADISSAISAHDAMVGRPIHGQPIKTGWGKPDQFKPQQEETERDGPPPCRNLWLGNVDPSTTEDQIRSTFIQFGSIEKIRVLPGKNCAFVNFADLNAALEAKKRMQGHVLNGRNLKINFGKEIGGTGGGIWEDPERARTPPPREEPPAPPVASGPPAELIPINTDQQKVIDKMAEFVVRNGPAFEENLKEKQKDNPKFSFLFEDNEYYEYYKWKIYDIRNNSRSSDGSKPSTSEQSSQNDPFQAFEPLSDEDVLTFTSIIDTLVATKDAIRGAKDFIMERSDKAKDIAAFLADRVKRSPDFDTKLNIIYVVNDVLYHSKKKRKEEIRTDVFSFYFKNHLGSMMRSAYLISPTQLEKLTKLLRLWETNDIYSPSDIATIQSQLESESGSPSAVPYSSPPQSSSAYPSSNSSDYSSNHFAYSQAPIGTFPAAQKILVNTLKVRLADIMPCLPLYQPAPPIHLNNSAAHHLLRQIT